MYNYIILLILFSNLVSQIFIDFTEESGTEYTYPHYNMVLGAGVTIVDINNDGLDDILSPTYIGENIKLFINQGDLTFVDMAEFYGIADESESKQALVADYNNDGFNDIYIINFNDQSKLYKNINNEYFENVTTSSGLSLYPLSSRGGTWFDYDKDGFLDLFVINYYYEELNILYKNEGDGTFIDVTDIAGVGGNYEKNPLVVSTFDYDNDGWVDIYIGNDRAQGNYLYKNMEGNSFIDVSLESGAGVFTHSMAIALYDYENDNDLDIYITNIDDGNNFLKNNGNGTFIEVGNELGLAVNRITWGATFFDIDNDGLKDLYVASACDEIISICDEAPLSNNDVLFKLKSDWSFIDISPESGFEQNYYSYGSATGDLNNDGCNDLYVLHESTTNILYMNQYVDLYEVNNNWIKIKLEGTESNYNGIGSRIFLYSEQHNLMEEVTCGISYQSQDSYRLNFGVGEDEIIDSVIVVWPSGIVDNLYNLEVNQEIIIIEDHGLACGATGDLNGDGGWNVLDVVTLANCVLAENCADLENGCAGDLNQDGGWNVLDIVTLANCVLAENCSG